MYDIGTQIKFGKKPAIIVFFNSLSSDELLGYFPWFVVSKSLRIEVLMLVYYIVSDVLASEVTLRFLLKIPKKSLSTQTRCMKNL